MFIVDYSIGSFVVRLDQYTFLKYVDLDNNTMDHFLRHINKSFIESIVIKCLYNLTN